MFKKKDAVLFVFICLFVEGKMFSLSQTPTRIIYKTLLPLLTFIFNIIQFLPRILYIAATTLFKIFTKGPGKTLKR